MPDLPAALRGPRLRRPHAGVPGVRRARSPEAPLGLRRRPHDGRPLRRVVLPPAGRRLRHRRRAGCLPRKLNVERAPDRNDARRFPRRGGSGGCEAVRGRASGGTRPGPSTGRPVMGHGAGGDLRPGTGGPAPGLSGSPGRLPSQGPHGSGRAPFAHPALQARRLAARSRGRGRRCFRSRLRNAYPGQGGPFPIDGSARTARRGALAHGNGSARDSSRSGR